MKYLPLRQLLQSINKESTGNALRCADSSKMEDAEHVENFSTHVQGYSDTSTWAQQIAGFGIADATCPCHMKKHKHLMMRIGKKVLPCIRMVSLTWIWIAYGGNVLRKRWLISCHVELMCRTATSQSVKRSCVCGVVGECCLLEEGGRPTTQRRQKEMHMFNVSQDIAAFEHKMLQQVADWEPDYAWVPRPLSCGTRYFLVLFSGHRRFADMAQWFSWTSDIVPICIDLAVDPVHGNVLKDALWVRLIRARKVTGAHAGPPARLTALPDGWRSLAGGGRGRLRDTGAPWGKDHLTLKEGEQVYIGTILMLQAIYLLMAGIFAWWQLHFGASEGTRVSWWQMVHMGFCFYQATHERCTSEKSRFHSGAVRPTIHKAYIFVVRKVGSSCGISFWSLSNALEALWEVGRKRC